MTLNNAGDAVSPTPYQSMMGVQKGLAPELTDRAAHSDSDCSPRRLGESECQDSDRVAAPAPIQLTKKAPASVLPPRDDNPISSIPIASREQTLLEFKRDFAQSRLKELRWMCANNPSERWKAKLEEAGHGPGGGAVTDIPWSPGRPCNPPRKRGGGWPT